MKPGISNIFQGGFATNYFGDKPLGDYSEFDGDGTLQAYGDATCFRDELQSLFGSRMDSPSGDISYNYAEGSVTFEASARYPTDYLVVNHQINHDWMLGSTIEPHIHWWQTSAGTPNWILQYRWQKMRQGEAKTTVWTPVKWTTNAFTWASGTINQISSFGQIAPPANYGQVSDIVQFKLFRDVTNVSGLFAGADGLGNIDALNFDTHIEVDMLGSREEYIK